ncbi:MAG: glycoside hydrolase family 3 protein [Chloroflexi bacterium]|nr:glycoside hydrolase family 3 protein [Chloroflexota bacterium]
MKEQLGYKLMLAFNGYAVPDRIAEWIDTRPLGGISLFRPLNVKTPGQVRELTTQLQTLAHQAGQPPLLIATDQEGGQLNALGEETTQFAGNMALGAVRDRDLTFRVGQAMGRECAAMGININYAPNCDINSNPDNPAAGVRTFGDDAALAADMAAAITEGFQSATVAATIKHFPGKGDAIVDSHYQMPLIDHSRERLTRVELRPFQAAIDAGAKLVMTGHFAIPSLTGTSELPATLSRAVMHDLVRQELGFEGVVITDALDMGAITQGAGQIVDVIAAARAEVDLMLTTNQPEVQERILAGLQLAYGRDLIRDVHLTHSIQRIKNLKSWAGQQMQPDIAIVNGAAHQQLAQELAQRAITLVRDEANLLPLNLPSEARIAVVMPQPEDLTPADTSSFITPTLATAVREYHPAVDEFISSHRPPKAEISGLKAQLAGYDLLIVGTINAGMQPEQAALANGLLALNMPTIMVALRTPYDLRAFPQADVYLCTYSILPPSMQALAAAMFGKAPINGRLPVTIEGLYSFGYGEVREWDE